MTGVDLAALRVRAEGVEIWTRSGGGDELVFVEADSRGSYVGWTPRERAKRLGYEIARTPRDETLLALVEAVEAAQPFIQATEWLDDPQWGDDEDDEWQRLDNVQMGAIRRFRAALAPFRQEPDERP